MDKKTKVLLVIVFSITSILLSSCYEAEKIDLVTGNQEKKMTSEKQSITKSSLERIKYNQKNLTVDLGKGLWSQPLPMDYDDDGDYDLLVVSNDVPSNGLYFFENSNGNIKHPIFKPPVRLSQGMDDVTISYIGERPIVTTPGKFYPNIKETGLTQPKSIPFKGQVHNSKGTVRGNQWSYVDYNSDGVLDLMVGIGDTNGESWDKHG